MVDFKKELEEIKIIDTHMHLGLAPNIYFHDYSDEKVISMQKKFKVKRCLCSHVRNITGNIDDQVEVIIEGTKKFGDFIYWYMIYDPRKPVKSIEQIDRNKGLINFAGIKIHPVIHKTPLDDVGYIPLWEYAIDNNIVILTHTWSPYTDNPNQMFGNPLLLEGALKRLKKLKIILGHTGGKISFYPKVFDFASRFENIYLDFSGDTFCPMAFRKAIDILGNYRILFGSDMPWIDIRYHLINVILEDITNIQKKDIFYKNATNLFNIKLN